MPKKMPTALEKPMTSRMLLSVNCAWIPNALAIPKAASVPIMRPINPPSTLKITDSIRNWTKIWRVVAPSAFRVPISFVRSAVEVARWSEECGGR